MVSDAAEYSMRRWFFEDAPGRFDIDLGNSSMPYVDLNRIPLPETLSLGYGGDRGTPELRRLIAEMYHGEADATLVTHGAQESLYLLFTTLLRPGDQVITFRPGWLPSRTVPARRGCRVDVLPYRPDMTVDLDQVRAAATPDLRLVYLNSPGNPGGRRVHDSLLDAVVELVRETGGHVVLDEEYATDFSHSAATRHDRVVSVSGLSKVYGLPGLRIGWTHGPEPIVSACAERKHFTSIANSVLCETLACRVLEDRESYLRTYHETVRAGTELVRSWADEHSDAVRWVPPEGTPFAWIDLLTGEPSLALCRRALDAGVLLFPGETLGSNRGFRLGFSQGPDVVAAGLKRLSAVLRPA